MPIEWEEPLSKMVNRSKMSGIKDKRKENNVGWYYAKKDSWAEAKVKALKRESKPLYCKMEEDVAK